MFCSNYLEAQPVIDLSELRVRGSTHTPVFCRRPEVETFLLMPISRDHNSTNVRQESSFIVIKGFTCIMHVTSTKVHTKTSNETK